MVKVKVTFGKVAIGVLENIGRGIKEEDTVIYRKGDIFDCPEDRVKDIIGSNQIEILEPTRSLENVKADESTGRGQVDARGQNSPVVHPPGKK